MDIESSWGEVVMIPKWATGRFMVMLFSISTIVSKVSAKQRQQHLDINNRGWKAYMDKYSKEKYIEHQPALSDMVFGRKNFLSKKMVSTQIIDDTIRASANSCEVISVYNTLLALSDGETAVSFPELLNTFEKKGTVLGGNGGGSLSHMCKALKWQGKVAKLFIVKKLTDADFERIQREYRAFIISTWNRDSVMDGLHSMCITMEDGSYRLHNSYGKGIKSDKLKEVVYSYSQNPVTLIAAK